MSRRVPSSGRDGGQHHFVSALRMSRTEITSGPYSARMGTDPANTTIPLNLPIRCGVNWYHDDRLLQQAEYCGGVDAVYT